jgi:predicted 3-demethylubiquinone-9 3-methyltransferase (glyoxalase superfamily)
VPTAPDEAFKLSQMVDTFVRAIDTSDFDKRLQKLENVGAEESANAVGWCGR